MSEEKWRIAMKEAISEDQRVKKWREAIKAVANPLDKIKIGENG